MIDIIRKQLILALFVLALGLLLTPKTYAASFGSLSDNISTSRPSASAGINDNPQAAGATQVSVIDNGSFYLASDSAIFQGETGQTQNIVNVASMSAQISGTPNTRNVYLTSAITNAHHKWTAVVVNVTATHTIRIITTSSIPSGGKIIITFPGAGSNIASPSAGIFSLNGEAAVPTDTTCYDVTGSQPCGGSVASNQSNNYTFTTGVAIPGSHQIIINLGCTAQSAGVCTVFASRIINPSISSAGACSGSPLVCTADTWKIAVVTQDAGSIGLDAGSVKVATINSVMVQAQVEPTITFSIAGLLNTDNYQTIGTSTYCGSEASNSGIDSSATSVNLGILAPGGISQTGQKITVSTNGSDGYAITATSSGHLIEAASGYFIPDANVGNPGGFNSLSANDTPAPAAITAGTAAFGVSPCGIRVPTSSPNWGGTNKTVASGALFSNPWNTGVNGFYDTIASYTNPSGAVGDITVLRYAATVSPTTPAGIYTTVFTYVATAAF